MSMASYEPDWDATTEQRYEEHRAQHVSDLCDICRNDVVAEGSDLCPACIEELAPIEPTNLEEVAAA